MLTITNKQGNIHFAFAKTLKVISRICKIFTWCQEVLMQFLLGELYKRRRDQCVQAFSQ